MKPLLLPATRGHMMALVRVRRHRLRSGEMGWQAFCRAPRCKWVATKWTHNGAHIEAARHRRVKADTKGHGARELVA